MSGGEEDMATTNNVAVPQLEMSTVTSSAHTVLQMSAKVCKLVNFPYLYIGSISYDSVQHKLFLKIFLLEINT
jgi:hypothetical protein